MVDGAVMSSTSSSGNPNNKIDDNNNNNTPTSEWANAFRQKASFMKAWKPASTPSNRDRLELYALHKQAVQGDAPHALPPSGSSSSGAGGGGGGSSTTSAGSAGSAAADRAKYQAWRNKAGLSTTDAMRLYCQEADRQVRLYGTNTSSTASATPSLTPTNTPSMPLQQQQQQQQQPPQPRGLAAIPLLCAAASESRQAYLRRLAQTTLSQAWWKRQETLTASPGTLASAPEQVLLSCAGLVEYVGLAYPNAVWQSFLWPLHNSCLAWWMLYILTVTAWSASWQLLVVILWGSRRTAYTVQAVWNDQVLFVGQSARTLTETHQPLSARLVGLMVWPLAATIPILQYWTTGHASMTTTTTNTASTSSASSTSGAGGGGGGGGATVSRYPHTSTTHVLVASVLYGGLLVCTWWYWFLVVPVLVWWWICAAVVVGQCYALIELAGV